MQHEQKIDENRIFLNEYRIAIPENNVSCSHRIPKIMFPVLIAPLLIGLNGNGMGKAAAASCASEGKVR